MLCMYTTLCVRHYWDFKKAMHKSLVENNYGGVIIQEKRKDLSIHPSHISLYYVYEIKVKSEISQVVMKRCSHSKTSKCDSLKKQH